MMKKNKIFLTIFSFISICINAQNCDFKKDSVYYVSVTGYLTNGRPVFTQFVISSLDTIAFYIKKNNNDFLCNIYKSAIYVTEPYIGFMDNIKCLDKKEEELKDFNNKLTSLNKICKKVISFPDNNYKTLNLSIVRLVGDFWIIPLNIDEINYTSELIKIDNTCYGFKYYYKIKKIKKVIPVTKDEKKKFMIK